MLEGFASSTTSQRHWRLHSLRVVGKENRAVWSPGPLFAIEHVSLFDTCGWPLAFFDAGRRRLRPFRRWHIQRDRTLTSIPLDLFLPSPCSMYKSVSFYNVKNKKGETHEVPNAYCHPLWIQSNGPTGTNVTAKYVQWILQLLRMLLTAVSYGVELVIIKLQSYLLPCSKSV